METKTNNHVITIPLEFRIACSLYKLNPREVMQIFIDHATVYDWVSEDYSEGFTEASNTIGSYIVDARRILSGCHCYRHCLDSAAITYSGIYDLAQRKKGYAKAKRRKSLTYIDELYATMQRVYTCSDTFYVEKHITLELSKNFIVLCELNNCYPAEYLEYFMNQISIAQMEAKTGLELLYDNFTMAFFMKIVMGFGLADDDMTDYNEEDIIFLLELEDLRAECYHIDSLEERVAVFKEFCQKRYDQIVNQN